MTGILDTKWIDAWNKRSGVELRRVFAIRASIRVIPLLFASDKKWIIENGTKILRTCFLTWNYVRDPKRENYSALNEAYQEKPKYETDDASRVGKSVSYAARSSIKTREIDAPTLSAYYANEAFKFSSLSEVFRLDCTLIEQKAKYGTPILKVCDLPIWPAEPPANWSTVVDSLFENARSIDLNFSFWIDWYQRRVEGKNSAFDIPNDQNGDAEKWLLRKISTASNQGFWSKGAHYINATLNGWLEEARERARPGSPEKHKNSNFFISYATVEEPLAREFAAILDERGYSSIAQFKDFPQGNFVRQMREGIATADRFIALQSKAYWESDHCQSEWDAAYARDPGAKQRKIVPFLLEPAPLPPIASETVYKSLIGLTKAQRKKAIIEWIEYQPPERSPAQLRETLAKQASPDVRVRDEKIDAGPNTLFDKPLVDMDLAELPANLRALLSVLIGSLPSNTPLVVRNCLDAYQNHLVERGAQPFVGTIEPFADAVRVQIRVDAGYWDAGLESLFADFFKRHELLITHFPLNPERELLVAETPIDEFKASGDALLAPVQAVAEAMEELKSADLTTEDFDRVEQAHQQFSRDIASLPMPATNHDVTPKRRYVLGTIGFYERLLAALGAAAGISATPQGQAAIAAVSSAIATLMGFVL